MPFLGDMLVPWRVVRTVVVVFAVFSFLRCCGVFRVSLHDSVGQQPWAAAKHCHGAAFNNGRKICGTQLAHPTMDSPAVARHEVL